MNKEVIDTTTESTPSVVISRPTEKELELLLDETNFSKSEIIDFYSSANKYDTNCDGVVCINDFKIACKENGIKSDLLINRLFTFIDFDNSGHVEITELIRAVNPLLRGSLDNVASMLFDMYDLDNNGELTAENIIRIQSDILVLADAPVQEKIVNNHASMRSSLNTVIHTALSQRILPSNLDYKHRQQIMDWVNEIKLTKEDGKLDKETFISAIYDIEKRATTTTTTTNGTNSKLGGIISINVNSRDLLLGTGVMLFTFGGVWALLAVAALSDGFMKRHNIDESGIGILNSAYFAAGIISPFIAGYIIDHYHTGPAPITATATTITTLGSAIQWIANTPSLYPLLVFGRFLIGFGLEIVFFATVEVIGQIWPGNFGFMVGIFSLQINVTFFFAFLLLPIIAGNESGADALDYDDMSNDTTKTNFALFIVMLLCFVSTFASIYVWVRLKREEKNKTPTSKEKNAVTKLFAALGRVIIPSGGRTVRESLFKLPLSFYLIIFGLKGINYFFNIFSLFSSLVYTRNFGLSESQANLATGLTSLISGFLGPLVGILMDRFGNRSKAMALMAVLGPIAYVALALSSNAATVWIATVLQAIVSTTSDLALLTIPIVAGANRVGIAYGLYGVLGNLFDALVGYIAGVIIAQADSGVDSFLWFSVVITLIAGPLAWVGVYIMEHKRTFIETPVSGIVETKTEHLHLAALPFDPSYHEKQK